MNRKKELGIGRIEWSEELSVGIASIDVQHKKLIKLINAFYYNIDHHSTKKRMVKLLDGVKDYCIFHFATEELYMNNINYSEFKSHKDEHQEFLNRILDFEKRYIEGKLIITVEVTNFIRDWLASHVMDTDKKYTNIFIQNGIK